MKRSPIRKIGKIGLRNKEANKINYAYFASIGVENCQLCGGSFGLAVAHKEKREWYRAFPELLHSPSHIKLLCVICHQRLDDRSLTTKKESDAIFDTN